MLEKIATYIDQHRLFPESGTIIVAVSGGADSLCLLHVLNRLCGSRPEARYPAVLLHVAHLNHKLRGEASYQDAAFIVQLADSWGLPVTIGEIDVPALARQEGRSLEDAARTARYRFLRDVAQGRLIAVAHHADDQVETLLLHWLRGDGLAGMVGMLPRQQDIIRPLLGVTHAETVAYCSQHALLPLEDTSNRDPRFLRNRVRHELLPLLESMNPGIHATALLTLPLSLQRHLLRRVTARLCAGQSPLELRHYLLIEELLRREIAGTEEVILQLPAQLQVTRNFTNLVFERLSSKEAEHIFSALDEAIPLPVPGRVAVPGTPWIASAEIVTEPVARLARQALQRQDWLSVWQFLPKTRYTVYIDADRAGPVLTVRTRRPGDRMRPLGMAREKKVQDMLVNEHIPGADRPYIPLFFSASHCVWLAGVQIDDRVRLTATTQRILRLSIEPSSVI
ncbi:MAG: tRNA lysidine(34) synthetase TilS [Ktedonobacter sp. 13_1_20CM_4_53_11]|nr:MAG: tRNA lysidine(34) synthetase TilS [Ktedonobacter sp. 13_1_20CM_4_53_11]